MRPPRLHIGVYDEDDKYLEKYSTDFLDRPSLTWAEWFKAFCVQAHALLHGYKKDQEAMIKQEEMFK